MTADNLRTGYTSTPAVAEREARAIVRWQLRQPRFLVRAVLVEVVMSLVGAGLALAALVAFGVPLPPWWVLVILLVPALAGACVLDVRRSRRRMERAATEIAMQTCPLGTPVTAVWHADHADVSTATLTDVIAFEEVSRAVWDEAEGVLCLERREGRFWVVPRELVSSESLGLLRESLGSRWAL